MGTIPPEGGRTVIGTVPCGFRFGVREAVPAYSLELFSSRTASNRLRSRQRCDVTGDIEASDRKVSAVSRLHGTASQTHFGKPEGTLSRRLRPSPRETVPKSFWKRPWVTKPPPRSILASVRSVEPRSDALAMALEELRFRCVLADEPTVPGPWRRVFPEDAVSLHVVLEGGCLISADLELSRYRLDPGEVLVVNRAIRGGLRATSEADPPEVLSVRVHLEAALPHPMVAGLPSHIRASAGRIPRSFAPSLHALREELAIHTPGARVVATRLCEVLFVQALRAHIDDGLAWNDQGFFRLLADP